MTETKADMFDLSDPRLAPLRREELPSFLLDLATATLLAATPAAARLGLAAGTPAPPQVLAVGESVSGPHARPSALVRLRLPDPAGPLLLRCQRFDLEGGRALLFADPAALQETVVLAVEPEPAPRVSVPLTGLEPEDTAQRFTLETDAESRLRTLSSALTRALGAEADAWIGATFAQLEASGHITSATAITAALAAGTSFSGVPITVPGAHPLELELGGVPLFDAARRRVATRGFGTLRRWRMATPADSPPAPASDAGAPRSALPPDGEPVAAPANAPLSNVVPFGSGLSAREASTFDEIGRTLSAAIGDTPPAALPMEPPASAPPPDDMPPDEEQVRVIDPVAELLDALPLATLLEVELELLHANRAFLQWTGWPDLAAVRTAGGLSAALQDHREGESRLLTAEGAALPVEDCSVAAPFVAPEAQLHVLRRLDWPRLAPGAGAPPADPRRAALDLVPWPLLLLDNIGHILFANQAASRQLGYPANSLEGEPFTLAIAPAMRPEAVTWLDRAAAAEPGEPLNPMELRLRNHEGMEFLTLAGLAAVGDDAAQLCLVLGPAPRRPAERLPPAPPSPPPENTMDTLAVSPDESASEMLPAPGTVRGDGQPVAACRDEPLQHGEPLEEASVQPVPTAPREEPGSQQHPSGARQEVLRSEVAPQDVVPEAAGLLTTTAEASLHRLARRLVDSLGPSFATLTGYAPDEERLPDEVRAALATVRHCLDDLGALAAPPADDEPVLTTPAPLVRAAVAELQPAARRRRLTLRTDIDDVPPVLTRPAPLARLIRVLLEEALDAAPAGSAVIVTLLCDLTQPHAPVRLQVSDAGVALDEAAEAAARAPLAPTAGDDRFSRAGRPLRLARLVADAQALGGRFELSRGRARGIATQLLLPR